MTATWEFDPARDGGWVSGACLRADEPDQASVERDWPRWKTWRGTDRLCHALRREGAPLTVRGEDWLDLSQEIRRAEAMLEDSRPAWCP